MAAFVPYASNVAGTYPTLPAAAVLYSVVLLIGALIGFFKTHHLIESRAYKLDVTPERVRATYRRIRLSLYIRLVGLVFAFFLPLMSYLIAISKKPRGRELLNDRPLSKQWDAVALGFISRGRCRDT